MPIKQRRPKAREHRITPQAVEAFKAGHKVDLHRAMGLAPWVPSPIEANGPCPWPAGTGGGAFWALAQRLRNELEEAVSR